jgi:hypothetical protein
MRSLHFGLSGEHSVSLRNVSRVEQPDHHRFVPEDRQPFACRTDTGIVIHDERRGSGLRVSFLCRGFGGQRETKTCAARGVVSSPQAATMRFDDGAADAKSHAGAMGLGSKEGVEDLLRLL